MIRISTIQISKQVVDEKNYTDEERNSTDGAVRIWIQYLRSGSSLWQLFWVVALLVISQIVMIRVDFYLAYWTSREELRLEGILGDDSRTTDLIVYAIILGLVVVVRYK